MKTAGLKVVWMVERLDSLGLWWADLWVGVTAGVKVERLDAKGDMWAVS